MISRIGALMGALAIGMALAAGGAQAADKSVRLGSVYYRMICTECHKRVAGHSISPSTKTKAEWAAYLDADVHDASNRSNPKVSYFTSTDFRESVKGTNKAAAKLLKTPDEELATAVRDFVTYGAKDSDNPTSCQ